MRAAWSKLGSLCLGSLFLAAGCGAGGAAQPATAGTSSGTGGSGASAGSESAGTSPAGGQSAGCVANCGGSAAGGTSGGVGSGNAGGAGGSSAGAGGSSSSQGGSTAKGFVCPAGPFEAPGFAAAEPRRVEGVPPPDAFNNDNNDFTNIEGDVWIGDALYVSEINPKGGRPPARILKITADDKVSILLPDSGSNGLATNDAGELFAALHKDGSVDKLNLTSGAATPLATAFMGVPFDSPNDLAVHHNGTVYFTDPSWQAPMPPPQAATRAYRIPPGGMPVAIEQLDQPNGITLSKNQDFLYIGGNQLKKYPLLADGSLGAGLIFVPNGGGDGMVIDCADNLYVAGPKCGDGNQCMQNSVAVFSSAGTFLGSFNVAGLAQSTNVAFGGIDHKTLYVSGQGAGATQKGLFKVAMNLPGMPY